jgi:tetratricopeptide (TPR) repeat protein
MEQSDLALMERARGNASAAHSYFQSAYELEATAANALLHDVSSEPTRSVLFRSAATLAQDCGRFEDAEKLIYKALAGEPPSDIAAELRDLLEQVNFQRHLELRGVELSDDEIQMAITGKSVGFGMAPTDAFLARVRSTETLLYRTAERKHNRPYRDKGRRDRQLTQDLELYMSVPRAACFAVTFRVGSSPQRLLPGFSTGEEVIDELLDCLQLYAEGNAEQLRHRIKEEAYYRNFISLARTLQPDGSKLNMVGFTTVRRGRVKQVAMRQPSDETLELAPLDVLPEKVKSEGEDGETVHLSGTLKVANSMKKQDEIRLLMSDKKKVTIVVPSGMMSDIIKPLWDTEVSVTATRKGKKFHLMQICPR